MRLASMLRMSWRDTFRGHSWLRHGPSGKKCFAFATRMSGPGANAKAERARLFVLLASALALVATSAPPTYAYDLTKRVDAPQVLLTSELPNVRYRVSIHVTGVAPNGRSTTSRAIGVLDGTIAHAGVDDAPFVAVTTSRDGILLDGGLEALTQFRLAAPLDFDENCSKPSDASPCTATFFVDFARRDAGDRGGTVVVTWDVSFSARVEKDSEPNKKGELPWTVEIVPE